MLLDGEKENAFPEDISYCNCSLEDHEREKICQYFDKATSFIENARLKGERVLVHCRYGISRSSTIVLAYLIRYGSLSLVDAFRHASENRPQVFPNYGFWTQLAQYEYEVTGKCTIEDTGVHNLFVDRDKIKVDKS